jgi:hypothetical protein
MGKQPEPSKADKALAFEADVATYVQLRRRAMLHLEAAIASLLDTASPYEAASILRLQASILEEFE